MTDQEVAAAIDGGARTREEVTKACAAGGDCGACHGSIEHMIEERCGASPASLIALRTRAA